MFASSSNVKDLTMSACQPRSDPVTTGFGELVAKKENKSHGTQQNKSDSGYLSYLPPDVLLTSGFGEESLVNETDKLRTQKSGNDFQSLSSQSEDGPETSGFGELSENSTNSFCMQQNNSHSTVTSDQTQSSPGTPREEEILSEKRTNIHFDWQNENDKESSSHKPLDDHFESGFEELSLINIRENLSRQQSDCNSEPLSDQFQDGSKIPGFEKLSLECNAGDLVTSEAVTLLSENVTNTRKKECDTKSSPDQPEDRAVISELGKTLLENEGTTLSSQQNEDDALQSSNQLHADPEIAESVELSAENNNNTNINNKQLKYRHLSSLSYTPCVTTTPGLGKVNKTNTVVSQQNTTLPDQSSGWDSTHIRQYFVINKSDGESSSSCYSTSSVTDKQQTVINKCDTESATSSAHQSSSGDERHSSRNLLHTIINKSGSESTLSCHLDQSSSQDSGQDGENEQCNVINASDSDTAASSDQHQLTAGSSTNIDSDTAASSDQHQSTPRSSTNNTLESFAGSSSDHYLHAESMQRSDGSSGIHLLASLVKGRGMPSQVNFVNKLVHGLTRPDCHTHHAALRQALLLDRLPRALETLNMADAAECLMACDPDVQDRAVSCLEHILLVNRQGYKSAQDLSTVMSATILAIHRHHGNTTHLWHHTYLFLLAACELLRVPQLPPDVQRSINLVKTKLCSVLKDCQGNNRVSSKLEVIRQILATMTQAGSRDSLHQTIKEWRDQVFAKRRNTDKKLQQATFIHLLLYFHSLVLEIKEIGWSPAIRKLAGEINLILREIYRRRTKENIRLTFDIFAIRCLSLVLNTTFNEERQNLLGRSSDSPKILATLISELVVKSDSKNVLLEVLVGLNFHPCCEVRLYIADSLTQCDFELEETILKYIDTRVRMAGIKVCYDLDCSPEDKTKQAPKTFCKWAKKKCLGNSGVKLVVAFYLPKPSCLGRGTITKCMEQHSGDHQVYKKNLEMLQNVKTHPNFLTLHAFQILPMPSFYITEDISENRLLHLLLDRRNTKRWLSSNILIEAALDVVSALEFLDGQRIVLRDITTYNMTYYTEERQASQNRGDIASIQVKVADLGLASASSIERDCEDRNIVKSTVIDAGPVPTRWTSVEALCYGEFSSKSMVYALGYVLYELFTHGCQPFSEMQGRSTEDILKLVVIAPECTRPFRWPCFPSDIFDLLRSCTTHDNGDRPSLPQIKEKLNASLQSCSNCNQKFEVRSSKQRWDKEHDYPLLDLQQVKRCHVPERGIPKSIRNLKIDQRRYRNQLPDYWKQQKDIKDENYLLDPIIIKTREDGLTSVCEVLMPTFVETVLPELQISTLDSVLSWTYAQIHLQWNHISQDRYYEPAVTLADATRMRLLTLPGDEDEGLNVHTFIAIAECVQQLHQANWLHRDLKAENILITRDNGKIILAKIGRMVHLAERGFIRKKEMVFSDSWRWLSPEVLHFNVYTKENDIFMLGTTFWETYNIRHVCSRNPAATKSDLVPFPEKTKQEVVRLTQEGVHLPRVPDMPEWLYKLVGDCRHPDKEERPKISDVIIQLKRRSSTCLYTEVCVSSHGTRAVQTDAGSQAESDLNTHEDDNIRKDSKKNSFRTFFGIFKKKRTKRVKTRSSSKSESTKRKIERTSVDAFGDLGDVCDYHEIQEMSTVDTFTRNTNFHCRVLCAQEQMAIPDETVYPTDSHSRNIVSETYSVPRSTQKMTAASKVIKHRREDQLLPPLPLVKACDSLSSSYVQNSRDKNNRKMSSWGDEVSPLHLKNTDRSKQDHEEDEREDEVNKVNRPLFVVPETLCTEVVYENNDNQRMSSCVRPVPDDWSDKQIYVPHLPFTRAADLADHQDGCEKNTCHTKSKYLTPVPEDWWDKSPASTLPRSSSH